MPSQIHPAGPNTGKVVYTATYMKADGSPGELEAPPPFALADPALGNLEDLGMTSPGIFQVAVRHNGSVGMTTITAGQVDGDLGLGEGQVKLIGPFTDSVEFLGQLGAESATFGAGPEEAA